MNAIISGARIYKFIKFKQFSFSFSDCCLLPTAGWCLHCFMKSICGDMKQDLSSRAWPPQMISGQNDCFNK